MPTSERFRESAWHVTHHAGCWSQRESRPRRALGQGSEARFAKHVTPKTQSSDRRLQRSDRADSADSRRAAPSGEHRAVPSQKYERTGRADPEMRSVDEGLESRARPAYALASGARSPCTRKIASDQNSASGRDHGDGHDGAGANVQARTHSDQPAHVTARAY